MANSILLHKGKNSPGEHFLRKSLKTYVWALARVASSSLALTWEIYTKPAPPGALSLYIAHAKPFWECFFKNKRRKFDSNNFRMNHQKCVGLFDSGSPCLGSGFPPLMEPS